MGKIVHSDVGSSLSKSEWESDSTHKIGGVADLNIVRTATVVVAASDATVAVKAQADYKTTDYASDGLAIQAAIDALTAGRTRDETVKCTGAFNITTQILIDNYTTLDLTEAKLFLVAATNKGLIRNRNWGPAIVDHDIHIIGGIIDGNKANQTAEANDGGISLRGVYESSVENVYVKDFWGFGGIYFAGARNLIEGNIVTGSKYTSTSYGNGIYLTGINGDNNIVTNNILKDNQGSGIFLEDYTYRNIITNNQLLNNTGKGIWLNISSFNKVIGNYVSGNIATSWGILIDATSTNNIIEANTITNTYYSGIKVYDAASVNNHIVNNIIYGLNGVGAGGGAEGLDIVGNNNLIQLNRLTGVIVTNTGTANVFRNNFGYVTENSGTATVLNTTTSIVVNHGLATTPTRVMISLTNNPTNDPQVCWVDTLTATQFTIKTKVDPGATGAIFNWRAQVGEG